MSEKIRVIIKRPDEQGHVSWISNTLENLQRTVEGYIEAVTVAKDCVILCNEEGRLRGLPHNCTVCGVDFCGTIIVAGVRGEDFSSIPSCLTLSFFKNCMLDREVKS